MASPIVQLLSALAALFVANREYRTMRKDVYANYGGDWIAYWNDGYPVIARLLEKLKRLR